MTALPDALAQLDRDRADFLAAYDALTPAQRSFRPADGGWTADEIVQHVVKSETGTVAIVAKQAAAGPGRRDIGEPVESRLAVVEAFMRSDGRTAMPAAVAPHVAPTSPPDAGWRERLGAFGSDWTAIAEALPDTAAGVALMAHPAAGPLTAAGAARFSASHLDHHRRQLERLAASDGFPPSGA